MATDACPALPVLESFAAGCCADETVGAHVGSCAACREAVTEARENNEFIAGVRTALEAQANGSPAIPDGNVPVEPELDSGYQIEEEIHRGGQGVVYRAVQTRTRRTVAIKMLAGGHAATGRQKERFDREVRIAAGLHHPNIVTVYDNGYVADGRYGLVMEYIDGVPLDRWSRALDAARGRDARRRALRERLALMVKVCDAVLCAHQHSIVHRDLKPANILVDSAGEPHILDFGVARDTGPAENARLTHTGEFAGTLAYASPEQVSGDPSKVDTRTDIYSLGVIMYELISGKLPYAADGKISEAIKSIESGEPLPLPRRTRDPDGPWVDGDVSTIILKAMAKDPARRYQTTAALRDDIGRYLAGEAIEARRDSRWYVLRKTAARHRVVFTAAGLLVVVLALFGAVMALQARRLEMRGRQLAAALAHSNIDRGRALAAGGSLVQAEESVWPELIGAGVMRIDGPEAGFSGSPEALDAYWALWDIFHRSSRVARFGCPGVRVEQLYFDEGDRRLNGLAANGRLFSWSTETWEPVRDTALVAPDEEVRFQFAVAPSGTIAVFGGGAIRLVNPETGTVTARADDADSQAKTGMTGAFSPNGGLLATIGRDSRLRLWDAESLASVVTIAESVVSGIRPRYAWPAFSLGGGLVAAHLPNGAIGLWDTASGTLERTLWPPVATSRNVRSPNFIRSIAFGPDGTIVTSMGRELVVWPGDGGDARALGPAGGAPQYVAFLTGSDGRMLVSTGSGIGGASGSTIIWNLVTGEREASFPQRLPCDTCATSTDGRLIAVGSLGEVHVYDAAPQPYVSVLPARSYLISLSPDARLLALPVPAESGAGQDILLLELKSGTPIGRIHHEGSQVRDIEFARDGRSLFVGEDHDRVALLDLESGRLVREFRVPLPAVPGPAGRPGDPTLTPVIFGTQTRLSPDGRTLAWVRDDGAIGLWDAASARWIGWLDSGTGETAVIDFSPDSKTLVAQHLQKCVLWDVHTRQPKREISSKRQYPAVRFSPDGASIARNVDTRIEFIDADTGRAVCESTTPGTAGVAMVFHPGGSVLIASAFDPVIRLWDTRTGHELLALEKHTGLILSLLLTPDGNTLISLDQMGTVLVWDLTYYNRHIRQELEYRTTPGSERLAVPPRR